MDGNDLLLATLPAGANVPLAIGGTLQRFYYSNTPIGHRACSSRLSNHRGNRHLNQQYELNEADNAPSEQLDVDHVCRHYQIWLSAT